MDLSFQQTAFFSLNNSASKQQYSFTKQKRFKQKCLTQPKKKFYSIPSTITYQKQRAPSFTKFKRKMEFPEQNAKKIVPSPTNYSIKSDFTQSLKLIKGFSIPKQSLSNLKKIQSPGPGKYSPRSSSFLINQYSLTKSKKKLQYPLELRKGEQSPGPAYLVNISKLQNVISKFVSKKCMKVYSEPLLKNRTIKSKTLISEIKSKDLNSQNKQKMPQITKNFIEKIRQKSLQQKLNKNNNSMNSLLLNPQNRKVSKFGKFDKQQRKTAFEKKIQTPGPGYNYFSEFSRLQKKSYLQKIKLKSSRLIKK